MYGFIRPLAFTNHRLRLSSDSIWNLPHRFTGPAAACLPDVRSSGTNKCIHLWLSLVLQLWLLACWTMQSVPPESVFHGHSYLLPSAHVSTSCFHLHPHPWMTSHLHLALWPWGCRLTLCIFPHDMEAPISHLPTPTAPPPLYPTPRFPWPLNPSSMSSGWMAPFPATSLFHGKELLSGMALLKTQVWNLGDTQRHKEECLNYGWEAQKMHTSCKPGVGDPVGAGSLLPQICTHQGWVTEDQWRMALQLPVRSENVRSQTEVHVLWFQ